MARMLSGREARRRERFRLSRQPGGAARLRAIDALEQEQRFLDLADKASDEATRQEFMALAATLREQADNALKQTEEQVMATTPKQIRERMQKRLGQTGQRMAAVIPADDVLHTPDGQKRRMDERVALRREWTVIESQEEEEFNAWANERAQHADRLYHQDPVGDAAHESRRVADALETAALAQQYVGRQTEARNRLLPEARQAIARGDLGRARVVVQALERVGIIADDLDTAIRQQEDASLPNRREALTIRQQVEDERVRFDHARYEARIVHGFGSEQDQIRASNAIKLAAWRQGIPMPVGNVTPENAPAVKEAVNAATE